ncbi:MULTISPECIES: 30S ribosomal protein S1 [Ehrlichia]|uniref:Small ribosomal subunit protein bS1 n=1 Tax=Ehrlichia cf. muris str. EmCRT TaxID=1359167 RepID=A0A0F3NCM8_9RICK|nr:MULTISPECIES: 30S ribosomal protein S1 [Ehrlichia]KJV65477.1 30S ribosomal protein S1 [Ehrlichia cf. muris str. EmCRT]OUC04325.1 30S ribosomal protein S1 [Ehrlichia sp. Wisconsin_h]
MENLQTKPNLESDNYLHNIKKIKSNKFISHNLETEDFDNNSSSEFQHALKGFIDDSVKEGQIIEGTIICIDKGYVTIDSGLKSESIISLKEFELGDDYQNIGIGSKVKLYLEKIEGRNGSVVLSREKAIRDELWQKLEEAAEKKEDVEGVIFSSIKCGYTVDIKGVVAFLPASHVALRQVKDITPLLGKKQKFRILKMDKKQGNIVVSRKAILEESLADAKSLYLNQLNEGDIIEGKVKSITKYGVFIEIHESPSVGVVDGLLHITDISWSRVSHPSAVFSCGQTVKTKIIKIDRENKKISLGVKQLEESPWSNIEKKYPVDSVHKGIVTSIEEYGVFVELETGIEGLVHVSEVSWTKNSLPINQLFMRGEEIQVKVLSIDTTKSRMSLSMKRCQDNPWQAFTLKYPLGSVVSTKIKNITNLGIFVSFQDNTLNDGIEGLIRTTELSWSLSPEAAIKKYSVGDYVEAKILMINPNKSKIDLGIKQLEYDPFLDLLKKTNLGDNIPVTVTKVVEDTGILVDVFNGSNSFNLLIEQEYLPDNKKFFPGDKLEAEVLLIETYNMILSLKH